MSIEYSFLEEPLDCHSWQKPFYANDTILYNTNLLPSGTLHVGTCIKLNVTVSKNSRNVKSSKASFIASPKGKLLT